MWWKSDDKDYVWYFRKVEGKERDPEKNPVTRDGEVSTVIFGRGTGCDPIKPLQLRLGDETVAAFRVITSTSGPLLKLYIYRSGWRITCSCIVCMIVYFTEVLRKAMPVKQVSDHPAIKPGISTS